MADSHHSTVFPASEYYPDRGPAKYFHGRRKVLNDFSNLLQYASNKSWGTTFLVQGAPGVGKSALLHECGKHARAQEWQVVKVGVESLWKPYKLLDSLGLTDKYKLSEKSMQFGLKNLFRRGYKSTRPEPTVESILKDGQQPLLLILDEAQALGDKDVPPSQHKTTAIHVLEFIHNGELGRPVILLAAGLGGAKRGFGELEIPRFAANCFVELGALDKGSERAVIRDWIKKEGGAKGDPAAWIDAIAQETHGWPQHIQSYANLAADQLKAYGRIMESDQLNAVLEAGRESRTEYYKERVDGFFGDEIQCLVNSIPDNPSGPPASRIDIMSSLTKKYGDRETKDLFDRFIRKGILEKSGAGLVVPIPSMHAWMKDEYSREKIEFPREQQISRGLHERSSGLER